MLHDVRHAGAGPIDGGDLGVAGGAGRAGRRTGWRPTTPDAGPSTRLKRITCSSPPPPMRSTRPNHGETSPSAPWQASTSSPSTPLTASKSRADVTQRPAGGELAGGDAEVEVDVGVHPEQEVLQDHGSPAPGRGEGGAPGVRARPIGAPGVVGGEVAAGEAGDEALHPNRVLEATLGGPPAHGGGHGEVHRREVADAIVLGDARVRRSPSAHRSCRRRSRRHGGDATSLREHGLGLGHLGDALAAVVEEIGLHHDRRAPDVQRAARGVDAPLAHAAEEVGLRLDRRGVRPRRQVEERAQRPRRCRPSPSSPRRASRRTSCTARRATAIVAVTSSAEAAVQLDPEHDGERHHRHHIVGAASAVS